MVSLLFVVFLVLMIFFIARSIKEYRRTGKALEGIHTFYTIFAILAGAGALLSLPWVISCAYTVGTEHTIDRKIAMYQEENVAIEERIDIAVKEYMNFETSTYGELKDKDAISLVSLFPELKSDTLLQKQLDIYVENNNKIKELKEAKIDVAIARWQLYFGR